jgi:hypothetical protein
MENQADSVALWYKPTSKFSTSHQERLQKTCSKIIILGTEGTGISTPFILFYLSTPSNSPRFARHQSILRSQVQRCKQSQISAFFYKTAPPTKQNILTQPRRPNKTELRHTTKKQTKVTNHKMLTDMTNAMIQRRNKNELIYNTMSFPMKLHTMLQDSERLGFEGIVSWQPGGKSFKVVDADRFGTEIMQDYFNQTKYKSFQRQLNMYGFKRVHLGANNGGYFHRYFAKATPALCDRIGRRSTWKDFNVSNDMKDLQVEPTSLIDVISSIYSNDQHDVEFFSKDTCDDSSTPCEDLFLGDGGDDFMDAGFLSLLSDDASCHEHSADEQEEDELESEHSFPFKLHRMLEHAKKENFHHIVSWVNDGSAFKVHNSRAFVEKVMPNYFDQTKYESFRRQLNLYGFRRVSRGVERGVITHPSFLEGARSMCGNVIRKSKAETTSES